MLTEADTAEETMHIFRAFGINTQDVFASKQFIDKQIYARHVDCVKRRTLVKQYLT